jgi:hypothetical protein
MVQEKLGKTTMETDTQKINKQRVLESDTTGSIADDIEFDIKSLIEGDDGRTFAEKFKDFEIDKDSSIFSNDASIRRQMADFERKSLYIKIAEMKNLPTPSQHLKKIVNVIGPWFNQPKKLGTTSVNGSNIIYLLIFREYRLYR